MAISCIIRLNHTITVDRGGQESFVVSVLVTNVG